MRYVQVTWSSRLTLQGIGRELVAIWVGAWVNVLLKLELHIAADNMYGYRIEAYRSSHFKDSKHIKVCFRLNLHGSDEMSFEKKEIR